MDRSLARWFKLLVAYHWIRVREPDNVPVIEPCRIEVLELMFNVTRVVTLFTPVLNHGPARIVYISWLYMKMLSVGALNLGYTMPLQPIRTPV